MQTVILEWSKAIDLVDDWKKIRDWCGCTLPV